MARYGFDGDYLRADDIVIDNPYTPYSLVNDRFSQTLSKANEVLELLIGSDGTGGLIGEMDEALSAPPTIAINASQVDTSVVLATSGMSVPSFDSSGMTAVPVIEVDFSGITKPADISIGMSWAEATLPEEVYNALKTQLLLDLEENSTGINATVETAIYTRARNRQQAENLAAYNRINNTISQLQHALPSGAAVALLADFSIGQVRQEADLEGAIIETQAKLAQENRKNAVQGAIQLDQLIRQTRGEESARAFETAKTLADMTIRKYSEDIKAFQSLWEGKRAEVQAKAENVRAAIDTNKGIVEVFKAEAEAFGEAERAVGIRNESAVKLIEAKIAAADLDLRAQIGEATALVQSYTAETSINERVSSDRMQVASHVAAALLSAVNASASIGYSGQESASTDYRISISGSEQHSAQHDPIS